MTHKSDIIIGLLILATLLVIVFGSLNLTRNDTIIKNMEEDRESLALLTSRSAVQSNTQSRAYADYAMDERVKGAEKFADYNNSILDELTESREAEREDLFQIKINNQVVFEKINMARERLGQEPIKWGGCEADLSSFEQIPPIPPESRYFSPSITRENLSYNPSDFGIIKNVPPPVKVDRTNIDTYIETLNKKSLRVGILIDNMRVRRQRVAVQAYNQKRRNCSLNLRLKKLLERLGESTSEANLDQCAPVEIDVFNEKNGYTTSTLAINGFSQPEIDGMFP